MNVLEKILEEIEHEIMTNKEVGRKQCEGMARAINIIRKYTDDAKDTNVTSTDDWIPVEERLPEVGELVKVTVHSSEWIGDYNSDWVSEEDKVYHPEKYNVYDGYLSRTGTWKFYDEYFSENTCEKEFGTDKGRVYDVVTAWQPLPEPYKGEEAI